MFGERILLRIGVVLKPLSLGERRRTLWAGHRITTEPHVQTANRAQIHPYVKSVGITFSKFTFNDAVGRMAT